MGRHSAKGGQDGPDGGPSRADGYDIGSGVGDGPGDGSGDGAGPRGGLRYGPGPASGPGYVAGPGPGSGAGGPGVAGPPVPAGPRDPLSPPAHPEHPEHRAWGTPGGRPKGSGHRGVRGHAPGPVETWAEEWAAYDTASPSAPPEVAGGRRADPAGGLPRRMQVAGRVPRPRQEFVDAFDAPPPGAGPGTKPSDPHTAGPEAAPDGGGKGRTLGGVAAAAVATVLAVVAAGQLTGGGKEHTASDLKDDAGRSTPDLPPGAQLPVTPAGPTPTATAASYDQLIARQYPLDPRLALSGAFTTVPGHQAAPGRGRVLRFRVDVERGLPLDAGLFSRTVFTTLNDPRSWGHGGAMTFERVSTGPADIVVTLASPGTTAKWCAKAGLDTTVDNVSCDAASTPRTMINAYRWAQGAATYGPGRMHAYRQMLINHEVGHRLGHGHTGCPAQGAPAPVMMQQTKFLSLNGGPTCTPNPWPYP